jgi:radical SAM superfamily enzyme YgiQ (UPF0313 family)
MTAERRVYFNEFNLLMGQTTYLPLVSGLLRAYAETRPNLMDGYRFMPFHFHIDAPAPIVERHDEPFIAAFSLSLWNEQLNLRVAAEVKKRYPKAIIVMGGAQVPHQPEEFFAAHPFLDVAVRGEGEEAFSEILERLLEGYDLDGLSGVAWRTEAGEVRAQTGERAFNRDLDVYPSPYLNGLFEPIFASHGDMNFQAIIETNRGCPFHCTFCYWGKGGLSRKYRYTSLERTFAEIDWMGEHRIRYLFNADSNFGMHRRDIDIAKKIVETRQRTGYPEAFRTCYGKNTDDKILEIGKLLHAHNLEKSITISYQSVTPEVQKNIKRDNIKLSVAEGLQREFNAAGVPVYTELILGLPGETAESWQKGIDTVLASGLKNQLFLYICQVLPNTELADPAYRQTFGIVTRRVAALPVHGSIQSPDWVTEYEDILVATNTMPIEDWKRMLVFSWLVMLMHSMKFGFFILLWLNGRLGIPHSALPAWLAERRFDARTAPLLSAMLTSLEDKAQSLLEGGGRGSIVEGSGDLYWDEEEAAFLRLSENLDAVFSELSLLLPTFLASQGKACEPLEAGEVLRYQRLLLPSHHPLAEKTWNFACNLPEWFDRYFDADRPEISLTPQQLHLEQTDFAGDRVRFARETILWGRKSGRMTVPSSWSPLR